MVQPIQPLLGSRFTIAYSQNKQRSVGAIDPAEHEYMVFGPIASAGVGVILWAPFLECLILANQIAVFEFWCKKSNFALLTKVVAAAELRRFH